MLILWNTGKVYIAVKLIVSLTVPALGCALSCDLWGQRVVTSSGVRQVQSWRKVKLIKIGYIKDKGSHIGTLGTNPS